MTALQPSLCHISKKHYNKLSLNSAQKAIIKSTIIFPSLSTERLIYKSINKRLQLLENGLLATVLFFYAQKQKWLTKFIAQQSGKKANKNEKYCVFQQQRWCRKNYISNKHCIYSRRKNEVE